MKATTPHNSAKKGDFAKTVLMPGDPMRAKYIATKFFENAKLVNNVRGIQGYTGTYHGVPVSVMASGMGAPSMLIYSNELYSNFDVENIIRVGSAGCVSQKLELKDLLIIQGASSTGTLLTHSINDVSLSAVANFNLIEKTKIICENMGKKYTIGNVLSSNYFYEENAELYKDLRKYSIDAVEMETASLYYNAMKLGKNALAICSISDDIFSKKSLSPEEREIGFDDMILVALNLAIELN